MLVKIKREDMRKYEILVDSISSYRTLLLMSRDSDDVVCKEIDRKKLYSQYQESKEKLVYWICEVEVEYNIKLFGNKYTIDTTSSQISIEQVKFK